MVIVIGGMHGNEPAGVLAIERLERMLRLEPEVNPGFVMRGRMVGLVGNELALRLKKRFVDIDLNRIWSADHLARAEAGATDVAEYTELRRLRSEITQLITEHPHRDVLVLDLHTTSAGGGIFSIILDGKRSETIARELHAPVVRGLLNGLSGALLHWCKSLKIKGKRISTLAFEAGQHDDPTSTDRAVAAIVHALRGMGCVRPRDVNHRHNEILVEYARHLPAVVEFVYVHKVKPDDGFVMRPGYDHFQPVMAGEYLADDHAGPILCPTDGLILMPLYQAQGTDGFYVVISEGESRKEKVESSKEKVESRK